MATRRADRILLRFAADDSAETRSEEANFLALNLMHDIVTGGKTPKQARDCYAKEFVAYRRKDPTPYMSGLRFQPQQGAGDKDSAMISDEQLKRAAEEGKRKG